MMICKIPVPSCKRAGTPCCEGCPEQDCRSRCQNRPERCGCWEDGQRSPAGMARKYDWDLMVKLHEQGLDQKQIAQRLKCTPSTVGNALKKMGVTGRG